MSPVRIVPLSTGGYQLACDGCDSVTAVWEREVAERMRDTHRCPGRWERGVGG